jgi:hypothetical protein
MQELGRMQMPLHEGPRRAICGQRHSGLSGGFRGRRVYNAQLGGSAQRLEYAPDDSLIADENRRDEPGARGSQRSLQDMLFRGVDHGHR